MVSASTLITFGLLAAPALAAPFERRQVVNSTTTPVIDALSTQCAQKTNAGVTDAWNVPACLFAAASFGGHTPITSLLSTVYAAKHPKQNFTPPVPYNVPRVTTSAFDSISTDGKVISQQNYIDAYYRALDATNGPYPNVDTVINSFARIGLWTAYCNGASIPYGNFADYYQYSTTVAGGHCNSGSGGNAPAPAVPTLYAAPYCQALFEQCLKDVKADLSDINAQKSCFLTNMCIYSTSTTTSYQVVTDVYEYKNPSKSNQTIPAPSSLPRMTTALFNTLTGNGQQFTMQNFYDSLYSELQSIGNTYPGPNDNPGNLYAKTLAWTGFCSGKAIPYSNLADWLQYSNVASAPATCT